MKVKIFKVLRIFLLSFLALLLLTSVFSTIEIEECICRCQNTDIKATGVEEKCKDSCGRACGGLTDCSSDCENCCTKWCSGLDRQAMGSFSGNTGCLASCKSTCELKKTVNEIISAILVASGIVAAIMIVIHGIRILTAQDPSSRDEAKKGILFVIFALAIIGISGALVNLLMGKIISPEVPTEPTGPCGNDFRVNTIKVGVDMEFTFKIVNNGNQQCKYQVVLKNSKGETIWDSFIRELYPGDKTEYKTTQYIRDLKGGYTVKLYQVEPTPKKILKSISGTVTLCSGELIIHPFTIDGDEIDIPVDYRNPSDITCEYRLYLYDKYGNYLFRIPNLHWNDVLPNQVCGECPIHVRDPIVNFKGMVQIALVEENEGEVDREKINLISSKAEQFIKEIVSKLKDCWDTNKPLMKDKVCYKDIDSSVLETNDAITEVDIKRELNLQHFDEISDSFILLSPKIITKTSGNLCINFNAHAGIRGYSRIYLRKASDSICR